MTGAGADLSVRKLGLRAGSFALRDVCLELSGGECCVLLGPTGSGKSLLIEALCGLRRPLTGSVHIAGRDVTRLDPSRRNIGYLPQDYALLPFQNVRQNLAFALLARRVPAPERDKRVDEMLALLRMEARADHMPRSLSGGERQRVALGRALIARPDVLLLDEPLSALDAGTADELTGEILRLRRQFAITTVHICHSVEEALRLGDRLAIIRDGRIVQTGRADELFARPRDLFVARLLRLPVVVPGQVEPTGNGQAIFCLGGRRLVPTSLPPGPAYAVIPPETVTLGGDEQARNPSTATLRARVLPNPLARLRPQLLLEGELTLALPGLSAGGRWPVGCELTVSFPSSAIHVIPEQAT